MSRFILFFKSKIALAIIGAVLFGSGAALIASGSFTGAANQSNTNQPQTFASISNGGGTPTPGTSPTATATQRQATTLHGTVTGVNTRANQFTVRVFGGAAQTVVVTNRTTFQGACTSLNGLQTGWRVVVQGAYRADGSFVASSVSSSSDN